MKQVKLEGSYVLLNLSSAIREINSDMHDNLKALNNAFATACENWQDKNAQACAQALNDHNIAMRSAVNRLEDFEKAITELSELARDYEDI